MAERAAAGWRSRAVPAAPQEEEEEGGKEGGRDGQRVRPATRRGFLEVMSGACRLAPVVTVAGARGRAGCAAALELGGRARKEGKCTEPDKTQCQV